MVNIPNQADIESLHRKYAPSEAALEAIWQHCLIVRELAVWCMDQRDLQVNRPLVEAGALLHDIGAYHFIQPDGSLKMQNYIRHGIEGEEILHNEGMPIELCRIASHHTGLGISAKAIKEQDLPLPVSDFLAETDEERLVMYADKFHSKIPVSNFNSVEWYKNKLRELYRSDEPAGEFEKMMRDYGVPPIDEFAARYEQPIR